MRRLSFRSICSSVLALLVVGILSACAASSAHPVSNVAKHTQSITVAQLQGSATGDWPLFGYNPAHTSFVDPLVGVHSVQNVVSWTHTSGPIFSSTVASLGMLYVSSTDGYLYALKQGTGALVWRLALGDYLTDSTPALEGHVLFVAVHSTMMQAVNAQTGQIYWFFDTHEKIQAPPTVIGNRVVFASRTTLWAIDVATGRLVWAFHHGVEGWPTTSSPAVMGNVVYVGLGSGSQLWAINLLDGHVLWSFDTGDRITSTPIAQTETVYIATWHGLIFALDRATGKQRWQAQLNKTYTQQSVIDGIGGNMALANNRLYLGDYRGDILSFDATQGKLLWRYATGAQVVATPIVVAHHLYIGSSDGYFYALDTQTGRPFWRYATGDVRSSACLTNNHLYIGSLSGVVYAFA